jgi:hypothetical protein
VLLEDKFVSSQRAFFGGYGKKRFFDSHYFLNTDAVGEQFQSLV